MTNINETPQNHPCADTGTSMDSETGMRRDAAGNPQHDTNPASGGTGRPAPSNVSGCETIGSLVHDLLERIDEIQQGKQDSVPTGSRDIDSAIQGLWPGQLVLIAGRPGMGESVLGLDFARAAALRHHMATVVFSSTMSSAELAQHVVSAGTDIPMTTLNHGRYLDGVTDERWNRLNETPLPAAPTYEKRDEK
ncbi:DnaB-like helicase C-terminal domain-containing protein [Bifidobacterium myosotis]|nr:DnaB-like helicase C-terminal domain-containing protein [Bifidobacterium myosotis]